MAQRLIVEGKDAIALANLCMKRKVAPPKGYRKSHKFTNEFVKNAGGYDNVKIVLEEILRSPDVNNIGIIIDADNAKPVDRFQELVKVIKENIPSNMLIPNDFVLKEKGAVATFSENLHIGIYIMPDNASQGYLEHFLAKLIANDDKVYPFAEQTVTEFRKQSFSKITDAKVQKATMHTWLALQKAPGQPFGTAIKTNQFNINAPAANDFIDWFKATFELEQ